MIAALDDGKEFTVDLLDGLHYINSAWNAVTESTLINCFRKCGFDHNSDESFTDDSATVVADVGGQLRYLQERGVVGLEDVTPDDYVSTDDKLETTEELTIDNIMAQVLARNDGEKEHGVEDDEDKHDVETPPITISEAQSCVDKLCRFFQSENGGCDFFFGIDQMGTFIDKQRVKSQRQTMLTDFFITIVVTNNLVLVLLDLVYMLCLLYLYFTCLLHFLLH